MDVAVDNGGYVTALVAPHGVLAVEMRKMAARCTLHAAACGVYRMAASEIDPPRLVPCLDVSHQINQKLHACTEPLPNGNERVRDIADIWLLEALLEPCDLSFDPARCMNSFHQRQRQAWPSAVSPSPSWTGDYPLLIAEHPDAPPTLDDAIGYLTRLVARLGSAS